MKSTYISILLITLLISSCKAQIAPLYLMNPDLPEGTHFKDLDNNLDNFEGTWKWQSNDSIIIIKLIKQENIFFDNTNQYEDFVIGEYKFTVNGTIVQDYISRLNDLSIKDFGHYLSGNYIMHKGQYPKCDECTIEEKRLQLYFQDPLYEYLNSAMVLRHKIDNGIEKIDVVFYSFSGSVLPNVDSPSQNRIPYGNYTFIKQ
ncbi:MAG: hypothetical protein ACJAZK_002967 [Psychroserpens sp.]|jgi:hypothetical protein|uniref:DUF6705 family protein n=1 Tax=Psychroserpens sp. TaxID=2020870 RepID=UPI0039E43957